MAADAFLGDCLMESLSLLNELNRRGRFCTGCGACQNVCPVDAVSMCEDEKGFLRARIDTETCIDCGKCMETCANRSAIQTSGIISPECYAVQASDDMRKESSSGGAFGIFAGYVLANGGGVAGASMRDDLSVHHICISGPDELRKLQKSKYVQSRVDDSFRQVQTLLDEGKMVLFSGTPCQIAGLYAYLGCRPEQLITLDLLCHGVPSGKMLKESLEETFGDRKATAVDFRDKDYGWESLGMTVTLDDGTHHRLSYDESRYEQGFHSNMTLCDSCYDCEFCDFPRRGDITIGDFWRIEEQGQCWSDQRGTSAVILNTEQGRRFFEKVRELFSRCEQFPVDCLEFNRIHPAIGADPGKDYFEELWKNHSFNKSVYLAQQGKCDVGIVGNWSYPNYGTALTYYSLYRKLKRLGYAVGMVSWPETAQWKPYSEQTLFRRNPYKGYEILPIPKTREELFDQSDRCDCFVLGSDQLLNNNLYRWFDKTVQMDWVAAFKRKIAYAASFGCDYVWGEPADHAELAHFLKQFDFFSAREESGVDLLREHYGVSAQRVIDPVFFMTEQDLDELEASAEKEVPKEPYLFAYILDADREKMEILANSSRELGLKLCTAVDAAPEEHAVTSFRDAETVSDLSLEDWIRHFSHADFVITDSFHGMCAAILRRKPFVAISNQARGAARFRDVLGRFGLESRLVDSISDLSRRQNLLAEQIDYGCVFEKICEDVAASENWLINALQKPLGVKEMSDYDILSRQLYHRDQQRKTTDKIQWEQLEDHRLRLDGVDSKLANQETVIRSLEQTDAVQWEQLEDHRLRLDGVDSKLANQETVIRDLEQTDAVQWEQLEDHRLRLDGVDSKLADQETVIRGLEQTNAVQWEQLEDHRLRLDGVDSKLADQETVIRSLEQTNAVQWEQLEDQRLRLDDVNAFREAHTSEIEKLKQETERLTALLSEKTEMWNQQLCGFTQEVEKLNLQLDEQKQKQMELRTELDLISKYALLYRFFRFFRFFRKGEHERDDTKNN